MKAILTAIVDYFQQTDTGFRDFLGSYVSGNSQQYGPFLGRAPASPKGGGPEFPFMVYDMIPKPMTQGFRSEPGFVENVAVRFHLYDSDIDRLAENLDTFTNKMDTTTALDLGDNELCRSIVREDNPIFLPEPITKDVSQSFHAMVVYEFRNARNSGAN